MADSITTQTHVLRYTHLSDNEIASLSTDRMERDNWARFHVLGWDLVKRKLAKEIPIIEEADLDDTDELLEVTTFAVVYFAFKAAEFMSEEHQKRSKYWYKRFRNAFSEVIITVDGVERRAEMFSNRRSLRG
jgi:hypothetical protein